MLAVSATVTAQAASFDCGQAKTPVEHLICSNETISTADKAEADLYLEALAISPAPGSLRNEQRAWLTNTRNTTLDPQRLLTAYKQREEALRDHIASYRAAQISPTIPAQKSPDTSALIDVHSYNEAVLRAKLAGAMPDYPALTSDVVNGTEREAKIAALKRQYASIDPTALYQIRISGRSFSSDNLTKHMISTLNERSFVPIGAASQTMARMYGGGMNGAMLIFDNITELSDINLSKVGTDRAGVRDLLSNNRTVGGTIIADFYFKVGPSPVVLAGMPTVEAPKTLDLTKSNEMLLVGHMVHAVLFPGTPQEFEMHFTGGRPTPPSAAAPQSPAPQYSDQLARTGRSQDFDVHGLKVSQTFAEVQAWATHEGLEARQDQFMPGLGATLTVFGKPETCRYLAAAMSFSPSKAGDSCIRVVHDDQSIIQIVYSYQTDDTKADVEQAILQKYGMPYEYDGKTTYYWGVPATTQFKTLDSKRVFKLRLSEYPNNIRDVEVSVLNPDIRPPSTKPKL